MCGLTGFWEFSGGEGVELDRRVERMTNTLQHRGPDDQGRWIDPAVGIALGFRRLAILDLSPTGHQPMCSPDGRWVVIFNGEIYNYRELRSELERAGCNFLGSSDTEVILAACSMWGPVATLPRLWGMFAIALWDRQERQLLIARDRLGKKPLYFVQTPEVFLFGSELKALQAHPDCPHEVNPDSLALYFRYGYVPGPLSILRNVFKLPPGHYASIVPGQPPRLNAYWSPQQAVQGSVANRLGLSETEAVDELDRLLCDAVGRRMIADVPLGALLSGGVDSSTVVALMQAQSRTPVKTFSVGFRIPEYDEAPWAKQVAQHLGTDHTELYATPREALEVIPRLPELYDEPFADSSQIPTFLVCELVRRHVTVGLSGDGGDELFSGYARYGQAETAWARLQRWPRPARRALAAVLPTASSQRWAGWLTVSDGNEFYHRFMSIWREPETLLAQGRLSETARGALPFSDLAVVAMLPDFTERMMYLDLVTYLPDDILVKVDRASMGVSLEMRCPLLDHRVVEWAWRLPLSLKRQNGERKWLLRQVLYRYVPRELVERPKMGFGVPIDHWLRGPLREWAEALLDERRLRQEGELQPEPIREAWATHLAGRHDEQHRLWAVLMFQAWRERWQAR